MQLECSFIVDYGMPGVVTAGITHYAVNISGKVINNLSLALVTPLAANYGICRHS
jgi:hypothetical protein